MRVAAVLPDEVALVATDGGAGDGRAPMRADSLGVLPFDPDTVEVLAYGGFERDVARRVNRIARTTEEGTREPTIRCEVEREPSLRDDFACVSGDETQLARLPFELHDIQNDVVGVATGRDERRDFSFHREPAKWNGSIPTAHAQRRVRALQRDDRPTG